MADHLKRTIRRLAGFLITASIFLAGYLVTNLMVHVIGLWATSIIAVAVAVAAAWIEAGEDADG